jgi:hypothetical protein
MKKYIAGLLAASVAFTACEKKVDPIDDFKVTVDYRATSPKTVAGDITVNPKDSIYFDFTITSPEEDMSYVEIQKNGVRIDTFRLNNAVNKRSFSLVKGYRADSAAGDYSYRVVARDERAIFMGDGGKLIKVTTRPDFSFWSYRILQVPDSVNKTNKTYFSSSDGTTLSYTEGNANSAKIDFGFYWDTTGRSTSSTSDDLKHTFYALNSPQPQLGFYDITSWTKNATVFKKLPSSGSLAVSAANFVNQLTSGGALQTLVGGNMTSGTASKVTLLGTSTNNNVIGFKTAAGKFGAILIRYVNGDSPNATTRIEVDVKVQK